jgi:hypothetical protein
VWTLSPTSIEAVIHSEVLALGLTKHAYVVCILMLLMEVELISLSQVRDWWKILCRQELFQHNFNCG